MRPRYQIKEKHMAAEQTCVVRRRTQAILSLAGCLTVVLYSTWAFAESAPKGQDVPFMLAQGKITQEQATAAALKVVPGKVTDFTVERKRGKQVYVVEIVSDKDGSENDVLVDMNTGAVIGIDK